jgi:hypothetical protein
LVAIGSTSVVTRSERFARNFVALRGMVLTPGDEQAGSAYGVTGGAGSLDRRCVTSGCAMARRTDREEEDEARRSAALLGVIVILSLAIAGILLLHALERKSRLEDCLMSGRSNCAPIELPPERH